VKLPHLTNRRALTAPLPVSRTISVYILIDFLGPAIGACQTP